MSIVFKPKIKDVFSNVVTRSVLAKRPRTNYNPVSPDDLERIVKLRAMNISYRKIAALLKRSDTTCMWHVHDKMLFIEINKLQKKLISEIMEVGDDN